MHPADMGKRGDQLVRVFDEPVEPVVSDHCRVVDYVLKTVLNGRLSYDEAVLVLPRARGEL